MALQTKILGELHPDHLKLPPSEIGNLPEKVLQFGTGALLRGLPDYFIDAANRKGIFNGRAVVVKSTSSGGTDEFSEQDGLYTICIRGIDKGLEVSENIICSAISRVLNARSQWADILKVACDPQVTTIISNTTEVGITYVEESIFQEPPQSFPAKLLACLHARYNSFGDKSAAGMVILPTELLSDNGKKLQGILQQLAVYNKLDGSFTDWLNTANLFCNTLVDCIVPGYPDSTFRNAYEADHGYTDRLMIVTEVYRLWAIEGDAQLAARIPFANLKNGIIIAPDIQKFKELKLRLLNGTHTLSCGLAFLLGIPTVKEGMDSPDMSRFIRQTMLKEIAPAIPYPIPRQEALEFAEQVLDRFRNPGIAHFWINITLQYSSKIRQRCVPVLQHYVQEFGHLPEYMTIGFAAFLVFSRAVKKEDHKYFGNWQGKEYPINDDQAGYYYSLWQQYSPAAVVHETLKNMELWGADLTAIPGFEQAVVKNVEDLLTAGPAKILEQASA